MCIRAGSPLFALFESGSITSFPPTAVSQSLPALLEELHTKLNAVDITVEAICLVMVRQALVSNEVPVSLDELAKLCGLLEMARECVAEMECNTY